MGHADWGTIGHLILAPCLPKKLDEMLIKSIDIAISGLFVKYQTHHGKTTKLQGEIPQYICCVLPSGPLYLGTGAQWADFLVMKISLFEKL